MKEKREFQRIPVEKIDIEVQDLARAMDDDHVIELSGSIARVGLLEPIVVEPKKGGGYSLIAGFHRLAAVHRLGWKEIPAIIRERKEGESKKGLSLIENIIRKDMSVEEECEAVRYMVEEEGLSVSEICSLLNKSRRWVEIRLAMPNYPFEVREALFKGEIGVGHAEVLARIEDEGTRRMILQAAMNGRLTVKEVEEMRKIYEETPTIPEAVEAGVAAARERAERSGAIRACEICGHKQPYTHLRPMWVCTDQKACLERVHEQEGGEHGDEPGPEVST